MELWTREWKEACLEELRAAWSECQACPLANVRHNVVFGSGNPEADILFVGEAPGEAEDESGIPFHGDSGGLLEALMAGAGLNREDTYITNLIACRPPGNRDPQRDERDPCWTRLNEIIYLVDPLIVVPIGAQALKALARGRDWSIRDYQGHLFSSPSSSFHSPSDPNGLEVQGRLFPRKREDKREVCLTYDMIPIVHPAFILREDGWDPKKPKFPPNGWAVKTIRTLIKIRQYVETLKTRRLDPRSAVP
jgi:uracil-DNA glycosylase family 4